MVIVYGLKSCDTCRKARKWLDTLAVEYRFHDVRDDGLSSETLDEFLEHVPLALLLNRRSTTWRNLTEAERGSADSAQGRALLIKHPALIKRPVWQFRDKVIVGFSAQAKAEIEALLDRG